MRFKHGDLVLAGGPRYKRKFLGIIQGDGNEIMNNYVVVHIEAKKKPRHTWHDSYLAPMFLSFAGPIPK